MNDQLDIVCFGQITFDTIINDQGEAHDILGGSAVYSSVIASSIGGKIGLVSRIGEDFDQAYINFIKNHRVDIRGVKTISGASTRIKLIYEGEDVVSLDIFKGVASKITASDFPLYYESTKIAHITPAPFQAQLELATHLKKKGVLISFDPHKELNNVDFSISKTLLRYVDIFFANQREIMEITKETELTKAIQLISGLGPKLIIVFLGSRGAQIFNGYSIQKIPPIKPSAVIDPVGAGDAFCAGFLVSFLEERTLYDSGLWGAACAAHVISDFGLRNVPTRSNIETLLSLK
jgi:sugar/nucleoside kinase (ribokinase family)